MSFDMFVGKTNYMKWTAGPNGSNYTNLDYRKNAEAARNETDMQQEETLVEEPSGRADMGGTAPGNPGPVSNSEKLVQQGFQHRGFNNYSRQDGMSAKIIRGEIVYYSANGEVSTEDSGGLGNIGNKPTWTRSVDGQSMTPPAQPETPDEIASVPDPVPATPPMGYDKFMNKKTLEASQQQEYESIITNKNVEIDQMYAEHPLSRAFKIRVDNLISDASQSSDPNEQIFAAHLRDVTDEYGELFHQIISNTDDESMQTKMIAALSKSAQSDAQARMSGMTESRNMSFDKFLKEEDEFASFKGMDPNKIAQLRKLADGAENPNLRKSIIANALKGHQRAMAAQQQTQTQAPAPVTQQTPQGSADQAAVRRRLQGVGPRGDGKETNPKAKGQPDLDSMLSDIRSTPEVKPSKPVSDATSKPGTSLSDFQSSRRQKKGKDKQAAWDAAQDPRNTPGVDPQEYDRQQKAVDDMDPTDKALEKTSPEATELGDTLEKQRQAARIKLSQQIANVKPSTSPVEQQEIASAIAMMSHLKNSKNNITDNDELFQKLSAVFPGMKDNDKQKDWYDSFIGQGNAT